MRKERQDKYAKKLIGYVYIISNPAWPGWYKIGRTINPTKRLESYQTGSPKRDYELLFSIKVADTYLEKIVQDRLREEGYGNSNEWFRVDLEYIIDVILSENEF